MTPLLRVGRGIPGRESITQARPKTEGLRKIASAGCGAAAAENGAAKLQSGMRQFLEIAEGV